MCCVFVVSTVIFSKGQSLSRATQLPRLIVGSDDSHGRRQMSGSDELRRRRSGLRKGIGCPDG